MFAVRYIVEVFRVDTETDDGNVMIKGGYHIYLGNSQHARLKLVVTESPFLRHHMTASCSYQSAYMSLVYPKSVTAPAVYCTPP